MIKSKQRPTMRSAVRLIAVVCAIACGWVQATTFTVKNTNDSGVDSLRQAIIDANAAGGTNIIEFAIPGGGVHTINLMSQLPGITGTLTINGQTQPGWQANTNLPDMGGLNAVLPIEVVGSGGTYGFFLANANTTLAVRALSIHGFIAAIAGDFNLEGTGALIVYGNYLCSSVDGSAVAAGPATGTGVKAGKTSSFIGGEQALQRNLISGCSGSGIDVGGPAIIKGNLVGTNAAGVAAIGPTSNTSGGMVVATEAHNIKIGGSTAAARNVISGNYGNGITIGGYPGQADQYTGLEIKGNYIGTDWSGTQRVPNGASAYTQFNAGIYFAHNLGTDARAAIIGGFLPGEANLIAYNNGAGIGMYGNAVPNSFATRGNAIFGNHGLKRANIDIGADGPTPNDAGDADGGANNGQNFPEILAASQIGNQLSVTYRIDSTTANSLYPLSVHFYVNADGGTGLYLASDVYPASSAQLSRSVTLTVPDNVSAIPLVAIATDAGFHSSEISPPFDVIFAYPFE